MRPPNEVKWALGSITANKASEGDGIPVELFQILNPVTHWGAVHFPSLPLDHKPYGYGFKAYNPTPQYSGQ